MTSSGTLGAWRQRSFSIRETASPSLTPPTADPVLSQPDNPPLLSWTAVQGATGYEIELDTDEDFVGTTLYKTKTTSIVVPDAKAGGTYNWRVRAQRATGIFTHWSDPSSYKIGSLSEVTITSPTDDANESLEDVVLDWGPVPGASSYEL